MDNRTLKQQDDVYLRHIFRYDVTTPNKNPLSDALSTGIIESLRRVGYVVNGVKSVPTETNEALIEKMKQYKANRIVILTLKEWLSEAYYNVGLTYDVGLSIMDEGGATIAVANIKGSDDFGDRNWVPEMRAKIYVPEAAKTHLASLFNNQEIKNFLIIK